MVYRRLCWTRWSTVLLWSARKCSTNLNQLRCEFCFLLALRLSCLNLCSVLYNLCSLLYFEWRWHFARCKPLLFYVPAGQKLRRSSSTNLLLRLRDKCAVVLLPFMPIVWQAYLDRSHNIDETVSDLARRKVDFQPERFFVVVSCPVQSPSLGTQPGRKP